MLAFAEIGTVERLRRAIRDEAFEHDPDEPVEAKAAREPTERLSFGVKDGGWRVNGGGDVDRGKRVEAALIESKDRLFDEGDTDVTWFDALVDIAERSMDAVPSRDRRDRYRTWFHVDSQVGGDDDDRWVADPAEPGPPLYLRRDGRCRARTRWSPVLGWSFAVHRAGSHPPHHRTPRSRLPCAGLRRGPVRRGPPHHPLARRRPDRHLEFV